jgi:hypothetical protein
VWLVQNQKHMFIFVNIEKPKNPLLSRWLIIDNMEIRQSSSWRVQATKKKMSDVWKARTSADM